MRQSGGQNVFDWSRNIDMSIKSRGIKALLVENRRNLSNLNVVRASSKVEWPLQQYQNGSRYLSRRVWVS